MSIAQSFVLLLAITLSPCGAVANEEAAVASESQSEQNSAEAAEAARVTKSVEAMKQKHAETVNKLENMDFGEPGE